MPQQFQELKTVRCHGQGTGELVVRQLVLVSIDGDHLCAKRQKHQPSSVCGNGKDAMRRSQPHAVDHRCYGELGKRPPYSAVALEIMGENVITSLSGLWKCLSALILLPYKYINKHFINLLARKSA